MAWEEQERLIEEQSSLYQPDSQNPSSQSTESTNTGKTELHLGEFSDQNPRMGRTISHKGLQHPWILVSLGDLSILWILIDDCKHRF